MASTKNDWFFKILDICILELFKRIELFILKFEFDLSKKIIQTWKLNPFLQKSEQIALYEKHRL